MYELMGTDTFEEVGVSPDLQHAFVYGRDHTLSLFGTDRPEPLDVVKDVQPWLVLSAWSPDARYFAYTTHSDPTARRRSGAPDQLWIVDLSPAADAEDGEEHPTKDR